MLDKELFPIGSFKVTVLVVLLVFVVIVLLIAAIAFRKNYILQVKLSQMIDSESAIHNTQGTLVLLKKKRKKLKKMASSSQPAIMIVQIDNLGWLYVGYKKKNQLLRELVKVFQEDLNAGEFVTRLDFNRICVVSVNRNRASFRAYVDSLNQKLDDLDIDGYGLYSFFLTVAVYENATLEYPKEDLAMAMATLSYAVVKDGNINYYSDEVKAKVKQLEMINQLKDSALANNQFVAYVQPKVSFESGKVVGGEVLVRWLDNEQNVLYHPHEFIPLFESNGFIKKIDMLMFENACKILQFLANTQHSDIVISTNFSRLTLNSMKNTDHLIEMAHHYSFDPSRLEIEITETGFMESQNGFSNALFRLRQAGFRVAMDDFGKEYSSLSLLTENKFNSIKMDKFFFENNLSQEKEKDVVFNIINMLSKVNCEIVLEGIESKQVLDALAPISRKLVLQGYYFSRPLPIPKFESFIDNVFTFDYPEIIDVDMSTAQVADIIPLQGPNATVQALPNGNTSINITGLGMGSNNDKELEEMRRQMDEMRHQFEKTLEEQRRLAQEEEMNRMREEIERLRNQPKEPEKSDNEDILALKREIEYLKDSNRRDYRDEEIERLRRQLEDMRNTRYYERGNTYYVADHILDSSRDRELDLLQRQIDELKDQKDQQPQQPAIDINELIARLSQTQNENAHYEVERAQAEAQSLKDKLEQERKEKEKLEEMLKDLQESKDEEPEITETQIAQEQAEADKKLDLNAINLSNKDDDDDDEDDDDDDDEDDGNLKKPSLTLEEIEAIIKNYQDKYRDDWNQQAKAELKDGYYEVIDGLKYYKGKQKRTFIDKIKKASPEVKQIFNMVKNEFMKYGVTNKLTKSYDCFYKGRNLVGKISMTSSKIKVYVAADPKDPKYQNYPHKDISEKKAHAKTPYYALIKSHLSVKRIGTVIADAMSNAGLSEVDNYKPIDYATKYKFYKSDQK